MPVIPAPHVHIEAALDAIEEHRSHHEARITFHQDEIKALHTLRGEYEALLITARPLVVEPSFDEVVTTLSGRIPTQQ